MNEQNPDADLTEDKSNDASAVNIQPSEPAGDSPEQDEKNNPGRTPGKAEGSLETVEEDLAEKEND